MTGTRRDTRTWHPPAAAPAKVADPATAAIFRALARAVSMGLDSERGQELLIKEIKRRCGPEEDEADPP